MHVQLKKKFSSISLGIHVHKSTLFFQLRNPSGLQNAYSASCTLQRTIQAVTETRRDAVESTDIEGEGLLPTCS